MANGQFFFCLLRCVGGEVMLASGAGRLVASDKARHRLRAQLEDGLEGYDKSGVSFKLYDICKHKHFLRISVLQVAELFLCAG